MRQTGRNCIELLNDMYETTAHKQYSVFNTKQLTMPVVAKIKHRHSPIKNYFTILHAVVLVWMSRGVCVC